MIKKSILLGTAAIAMAFTAPAFSQDIARSDTVIFDLDRTIRDPNNFNWMTDGTGIRRMHGAHQTMWEPLFVLIIKPVNLIHGLRRALKPMRRLMSLRSRFVMG